MRVRCKYLAGALLCGLLCVASAAPIPQALSTTTFVVFDVETTGLSASKHRVIEIGAVKLRDGRVIARQVWLINPGCPIPPASTRVHGINDADVRTAPPFSDMYPAFTAFAKDTILVAHNAPFDVRFLSHEIQRNALPFPPEPVLDALHLVRTWYPALKSHTLQHVAKHLGIAPDRYHRALDDALTLADVFTCGLCQMPQSTTLRNLFEAAGQPLYIQPTVPLDSTTAQPAR